MTRSTLAIRCQNAGRAVRSPRRVHTWLPHLGGTALSVALVFGALGCGQADGSDPTGDTGAHDDHGTCEPLTNPACIALQRGETLYDRWLADYPSHQYQSQYDGALTVIDLADLVDSEVAADPSAYRYQIFGTDGYTFGGFATWTNIQSAYLDVVTRLTVFDASQQLPHSYDVKESYLIVLTPAGG